jgi:hypothetical protein
MFSCLLLFVQYILSPSQYPETPRRFTTWGRAKTCLQETFKTGRSRTGNCISSDVILRNIYRLLLGNSQFTSFSIYVTVSRKSGLTLTPYCLLTNISFAMIVGATVPVFRLLSHSYSRFCTDWITFTSNLQVHHPSLRILKERSRVRQKHNCLVILFIAAIVTTCFGRAWPPSGHNVDVYKWEKTHCMSGWFAAAVWLGEVRCGWGSSGEGFCGLRMCRILSGVTASVV